MQSTTMISDKVYIYTIPKAGTYLMSEFLSRLGIQNSGWHISENKYLDTKKFDDQTNKVEPSKTKVVRPYLQSFKRLPRGWHAFGHFNPLFVCAGELNKYRVIAVKRSLKEVLVSEFVDFRFRRADVHFVHRNVIPDSVKAFEVYMKVHAPIIKNIAHNFVLLERLQSDHDYVQLVGANRFHFVDFKSFLSPQTGPSLALDIARHVGVQVGQEEVCSIWQQALAADNKTKSDGVSMDVERDALWSQRALELYAQLNFDELNARLGYV